MGDRLPPPTPTQGTVIIDRVHELHDVVEPGRHLFTRAKRKESVYTVYSNGILKTTIRTKTQFTPYVVNEGHPPCNTTT